MTVMYLYYNQPNALPLLEKLHKDINIIIVDDASAEPLKLDWATVLRVDKDIPWNMPFANNLGLWYLYMQDPNAVVLRMDIDHYFDIKDLKKISKLKPGPKEIIYFARGEKPPHPNIYLANVEDILNAGGYNTAYSGNYGYDDKELALRLAKNGFKFTNSDIKVNIANDHGTKNLSRDTTVNRKRYIDYEKSNS